MKQVYKNLIFLCLFFITILFLWYIIGLRSYLTLEALACHKASIYEMVTAYPLGAAATYSIAFYILTVCAFPVTLLMITMGGFIFDWPLGSLYALCALLASSITVFSLSHKMLGIYFQKKYAPRLHTLIPQISEYTFYSLVLVRLFPILPFFLVNLASGLTDMKLSTFIIATLFGSLPIIIFLTYMGSQWALLIV